MKARILRGANEVGGSCIELEADGKRIVLDVGLPITATDGEQVLLPDVAGLRNGDDSTLLGVVISHPHPDHFGLLPQVAPSIPVYMGQAASRILAEAAFFSPMGLAVKPAGFLSHRTPFKIGPFTITPYLNDHSAFDAYSMVIEAGGKRLFYSGDIRAHGRKAALFEQLLAAPPRDIDVLLMEGTHVRPEGDGTERGMTETDVENACVETFRATEGMVLTAFSPQNIDRLVTCFRAAIRSKRILVMDLYTAAIAQATGRDTIPQASWEQVRVYLPRSQRSRVKKEQAFERTNAVRGDRIYPEELRERRSEIVMMFRGSMARELDAADCLDGATAVWSMWPGYLRNDSGLRLVEFLNRKGIELKIHHSSGHAFVPDLQRLATAIAPRRLVPIHSFAGDRFEKFFANVDRHPDGVWWEL